ncbi:MAG: glycosyltransferase [Weeksellaceae bacterium]|nr:glycosyltransferase [Weeksellaceae bacterium]
MKVLQINSIANTGSTGRIAEDIGRILLENNHESFIGFGRYARPSASKLIKIGSSFDLIIHGIKSRIFDLHGFGSSLATKQFIKEIEKINPDIIHLHVLHGYYLNVEILFRYLKKVEKPILWTFHDCWSFTGHCSHFDFVNCYRWEKECFSCPNKKGYPASLIVDNSKANFNRKKSLFQEVKNISIVCPSNWLSNHAKRSFFKDYPIHTIYNGIDLNAFTPYKSNGFQKKYNINSKVFVLGVANVWTSKKGFDDFLELRKILTNTIGIVLVGLKVKQIKNLPLGIFGITHTESIAELTSLYSMAAAFVNPTYADNFPTTNIEALACGTPVITYNTGGSPEAVDENTGIVVEKGNLEALAKAIEKVVEKGKDHYRPLCRARAEKYFNKNDRYQDYLKIYEQLISQNSTVQKNKFH